MISWDQLPIRVRLTFWHTMIFGGIMLLFIAGSLGFFYLYLVRDQDAGLKEDLEVIEQFLKLPLDTEFTTLVESHKPDKYERFCEVWSSKGGLLFRSKELRDNSLGPRPTWGDSSGEFKYHTETFPDRSRWRVVSSYRKHADGTVYIRLAVNEDPLFGELMIAATTLALLSPFVLLLVALSGYYLARRTLSPVELIAATARKIGAENLGKRVPVMNAKDELGLLATTINELLERVRKSFEALKRFTSDASHELRTPLTTMRSVGEVSLQGLHTPGEYREIIGSILEENERLTRLVDKLLFLSRADGGRVPLELTRFELGQLLAEVSEIMGALANEKQQTLISEAAAGLEMTADYSLLKQAILDIVDNAIKYGPPSMPIVIRACRDLNGGVRVEVEDCGPGLRAEEIPKVFDRFYRGEGARGKHPEGTGLGLSIVHWIVQAHGGTVCATSNSQRGTVFKIILPRLQLLT